MDILQQSYRYGKSPLTATTLSQPLNTFLFGSSISRSLSPLLHGILFQSVNASWTFHLSQTTDKSQFQAQLTNPLTIGASITMPNKVTFGPVLDDLTEEAQVIGAVNTAFIRLAPDGTRRYIGTNTDCVGIRETILQREPAAASQAKGKPAMVVGGGGASRSAIYALWKWFRPSEIYIANRLESEVEDIIHYFTSAMPGIKLRHVASTQSAADLPSPYIVIGTIPDYPPKEAGEVLCWEICETILKKGEKGLLLDMCYMPSPLTKLLTTAKDAGWRTISGEEVLVRVCVTQQVLWVEREPSEEGVRKALAAIGPKSSKL